MASKEAVVAAVLGTDKPTVEDLNQKFDLQPTNDKIIVRKAGAKQTLSGLTLPENMKGQNTGEGTIVAVGPGAPSLGASATNPGLRRPMTVKPGDRVLFHKNSGTEIEINSEKLTVMNENDIMVILTPLK